MAKSASAPRPKSPGNVYPNAEQKWLEVIVSLPRGEFLHDFILGPLPYFSLYNLVQSTWGFMKQVLPFLGAGILVAGFMLGRPGQSALIPGHYIQGLVGGNSLWANLFAAVSGALMYFATLTEVPILQGLIGAGMGKGPSLSLLLAGPALSLPNMLVIGSVLGVKKTATFSGIIVVLATITGMSYGWIAG